VTTTTTPFKNRSRSISSLDAPKHTSCDLFSPIICNCTFYCRGQCQTTASLWQKQSASPPRHTTHCSISLDDTYPKTPTPEPPHRQTVDLAAICAEIQANLDDLARRFPKPMPTTTTMTTTPPLLQTDPPLLSPTPVYTTPIRPLQREAVDPAAIQVEIRESLDQLCPLPLTTTTLPLPNPVPPLPFPTSTEPTETKATAPPFLPMKTRIERLINNSLVRNDLFIFCSARIMIQLPFKSRCETVSRDSISSAHCR